MSNEQVLLINGKKRRCRVEVFALSDNKMLAFSHGVNSYLELPGGGVDEGETILEAGMRELAEEAGWPAINPREINVAGDWLFIEDENSWLKQHGIDEESNSAIVCELDGFKPTESYGKEDDHLNYSLLSIDQVITETQNTFNNTTDKRGKFIAKFRLVVLETLLKQQVSLESKPNWFKW